MRWRVQLGINSTSDVWKFCQNLFVTFLWKHCFLAMSPEGGQTRKRCFLAMFPEGGQTREQCFLAKFPEGG
jgi:hypothetical protein